MIGWVAEDRYGMGSSLVFISCYFGPSSSLFTVFFAPFSHSLYLPQVCSFDGFAGTARRFPLSNERELGRTRLQNEGLSPFSTYGRASCGSTFCARMQDVVYVSSLLGRTR